MRPKYDKYVVGAGAGVGFHVTAGLQEPGVVRGLLSAGDMR
jgi:hypothetical protein